VEKEKTMPEKAGHSPRVVVIMAGGSGERFWPLSRENHPKQLLRLGREGRTLLDEAVARALTLALPENVFVATGRRLEGPIRSAGLGIPEENVIGEPAKRNTLGCLVYMAAQIRSGREEDPVMAVLTADHLIGDLDHFARVATAAMEVAEAENALVTIGIHPTRPATEFGYLEVPGEISQKTVGGAKTPIYPVARFVEKPDEKRAKEYLAAGRYFWNSGMFFWRLSTFVTELKISQPVTEAALQELTDALRKGDRETADRIFDRIPATSIDYALMEKSRKVLMARGDFPWEDIGSWDSLGRVLPKDDCGNVASGEPILIDVENSIVYNGPGAEEMAVSVIGVKDMLVVVSRDGVLVVPKNRCQDVRIAVEELRNRGSRHV
jgi:mannose-1-phosphate guanylyltransferase